jgi:hypothetical protein
MRDRDAKPRIITAPPPASPLAGGQCDACPAAPAAPWAGGVGSSPEGGRFVLPAWQVVALDGDHAAVHTPHLRGGPIVLNRAALALARHFRQARALDQVPAAWLEAWGAGWTEATLARMVELGLLIPAPEEDGARGGD